MTRQDLVNKSIDKLNTVKEALELINILEYDECIAVLTGTKNLPSEIHSALMRRGKEANGGKTTLALLGLYSLYADAKIQVTAEEITSEVNKKVNSDDFGTLITQNAYNVRIAFNKGSSYMQFDSTAAGHLTGGQEYERCNG